MEPKDTPLKQIRTFQGDVAEALKRQEESLVSIQRREHLKNPRSGTSVAESVFGKKQQFVLFFIGSVLLLSFGIIGGQYAYHTFLGKVSTPTIQAPASRFFAPNSEVTIEPALGSRSSLIDSLVTASQNIPDGELRHIILMKNTALGKEAVTTSDLMQVLGARAPGNLVRAFDKPFMFGALGKSTFIVFKLSSFENAFAGMLAWEKDMAQDIGPLFATAPLLKNLPPGNGFVDLTDKNKDIRVLTLEDQKILMYSFLDNNMLIVTDNLDTMRVLVDRLTQAKLSR